MQKNPVNIYSFFRASPIWLDSNRSRGLPQESAKRWGAENVIVSFHAQGGQPISKWYKQWKSSKGETDPEAGKIYNALMETTQAAIQGNKIQTVTFIWMQGEADSKAGNSDVYLASLNGLKK